MRKEATGRQRPLARSRLFSEGRAPTFAGVQLYMLKPRNYLCPTDSAATSPITVASVPAPEMRSAVRQNAQCSVYRRPRSLPRAPARPRPLQKAAFQKSGGPEPLLSELPWGGIPRPHGAAKGILFSVARPGLCGWLPSNSMLDQSM